MDVYILVAFICDLLIGDPLWLPHPIRAIGGLITGLEKLIFSMKLGPGGMRLGGIILAVTTIGITYFITSWVLGVAFQISPLLYGLFSILLIFYELAAGSLAREARKIYEALAVKDLALARKELAGIVGRDTQGLEEEEIVRATVETVAENTVDGIVSPLFYIFLGGPALGMAYKAVNTLDSMIGYLNERYRDLGWFAARFDDLANWLPARFTGYLIPVAAGIWGKDSRGGYRILRRDKGNHKSPNAGYPEAAMAGVLGVRLGGTNYYFGEAVFKPTIGDPRKSLDAKDILDSISVMKLTASLALVIFYLLSLKLATL